MYSFIFILVDLNFLFRKKKVVKRIYIMYELVIYLVCVRDLLNLKMKISIYIGKE